MLKVVAQSNEMPFSVTRMLLKCLPKMGMLAILLPALMSTGVYAATVTATVTAIILPAEPAEDEIRIRPRRIELRKGEYAKLQITNDSGQRQNIHLDLVPMQQSSCLLSVTPKDVGLEDGAFQVFRLFYTQVDERACDALFKLQVRIGSGRNESIEVKCE